jgi:predicted alpha/beta hydrolase family esterase
LTLDSAIFASPFLDWLHQSWQIDRVNASFYKTDFDFENLKKLIPVSYTLYSDNDPYVDEKFSFDFSLRIASKPLKIEGAGHFNSEGSYNPIPLLFDLCKLRFT